MSIFSAFLACCCGTEWASDCSATGTMPGAKWRLELGDVETTGTMFGDGANFPVRGYSASCGIEGSGCDPRAFRWYFVRWNNTPSDPHECTDEPCNDLTEVDGIPTFGDDNFGEWDDSGYVVDMGLSSSVVDMSLLQCNSRHENYPFFVGPDGTSATPSGDVWYVSEISLVFRWVDTITVAIKDTGTCIATTVTLEAENLWTCIYYRRLRAGEPIATGDYKLGTVTIGASSMCFGDWLGHANCTVGSTDDWGAATLGAGLSPSVIPTEWKPPATITVFKSA